MTSLNGVRGVSEFCRVIESNFVQSLQPLINHSFTKIVEPESGGGGGGGSATSKKCFRTTTYLSILFCVYPPLFVPFSPNCFVNFSTFKLSFLTFNRCHSTILFFPFLPKSMFCRLGFNIFPDCFCQ